MEEWWRSRSLSTLLSTCIYASLYLVSAYTIILSLYLQTSTLFNLYSRHLLPHGSIRQLDLDLLDLAGPHQPFEALHGDPCIGLTHRLVAGEEGTVDRGCAGGQEGTNLQGDRDGGGNNKEKEG